MYGFGSCSDENEIWTSVGHPIGDLIIKLCCGLEQYGNTYHAEMLKEANNILENTDWNNLPKGKL